MPRPSSNKDYQETKFKGIDLAKQVLEEAEFTSCTFIDCDFSDARLKKCLFEECKFDGCNLSLAKLPNSQLIKCKFRNCKLIGVDWMLPNTDMGLELYLEECDLSYCNFSDVDISGSSLIKCKVNEADFSDTIARKVSFEGSDLLKSRFIRTNLSKASFIKAKNYLFNILENNVSQARFSREEVYNLLEATDIVIEE